MSRTVSSSKRVHTDESNRKKFKPSIDISTHWKRIQTKIKTNTPRVFECQSKHDYLILTDPLGDRSRFIISKSSYYWLNRSIGFMQEHIDSGTAYHVALMGEITEIERNLKALKANIEKTGSDKTFFFRAETLANFIRLCSTFFGSSFEDKNQVLEKELIDHFSDNPLDKYRSRLQSLFNLCAISWLHMIDRMLPNSIVHVEKTFIFDDDFGDFENDSIIRLFRKDDQTKMQKINIQMPNLRQILYTIVQILGKFDKNNLIDRIYVERFEMIYEIWIFIDNELNSRRTTTHTVRKRSIQQVSWNFLEQYQIYEQTFGKFISHKN